MLSLLFQNACLFMYMYVHVLERMLGHEYVQVRAFNDFVMLDFEEAGVEPCEWCFTN